MRDKNLLSNAFTKILFGKKNSWNFWHWKNNNVGKIFYWNFFLLELLVLKPHTAIKKDLFFKAISVCPKNSYFVYDGKTYSQIRGYGQFSFPIISEIVLDKLYISVRERLKSDIRLMIKYVDDSIFIIREYF